MRTLFSLLSFAAATFWVVPGSLMATDYFLTIGGGYSPSGNQVSLEKNVLFYERVLLRGGHGDSPQTSFFADGDAPGRDVQFEPAESDVPLANRYLARLFGNEKYLDLQYRDNRLERIDGETSLANLEKWFKQTGTKLRAGDRLIIYATAHGGKSVDRKNPQDTRLFLWNGKYLPAKRMAQLIEGLPADVSVTLIMAQCFSGGFAHAIFKEANKEKGDQDHEICGFFSTVHNRTAAGCTPDINEENYDEFSSHFWAAIHGETRTGKPADPADYDGDGRITFEEAHAYTILHANTIDIPLKTSEAFLRARAHFKDKEHPELMPKTAPYSAVVALARPVDKTVLERLSKKLGLGGDARVRDAVKKAASIEKKRGALASFDRQRKTRFDLARNAIRNTLKARWPELANVFTPQSIRLLTDQSDEFVKAVESHPKFKEWRRVGKERKGIKDQRFQLEKEWIQYQRFIRAVEQVVLAANLPKEGDDKAKQRYQRILAAESGTLESDS